VANNGFRPQPKINQNSRSANRVVDYSAVAEFKKTYVEERRFLERFRNGADTPLYNPASSLDGGSNINSPEATNRINAWLDVYQRIKEMQSFVNPIKYVKILFLILRSSSLAIPTIRQLASSLFLDLVSEHLVRKEDEMRNDFVAETQRAKSAILINQKGVGYPLPLAVYYALVDRSVELSSLLKYCLAFTTAKKLEAQGLHDSYCEKLMNLAKRYEFMAAKDYSIFPDLYDIVWGKVIPDDLRVVAGSLQEPLSEQ
jgi:hypothetical protein